MWGTAMKLTGLSMCFRMILFTAGIVLVYIIARLKKGRKTSKFTYIHVCHDVVLLTLSAVCGSGVKETQIIVSTS